MTSDPAPLGSPALRSGEESSLARPEQATFSPGDPVASVGEQPGPLQPPQLSRRQQRPFVWPPAAPVPTPACTWRGVGHASGGCCVSQGHPERVSQAGVGVGTRPGGEEGLGVGQTVFTPQTEKRLVTQSGSGRGRWVWYFLAPLAPRRLPQPKEQEKALPPGEGGAGPGWVASPLSWCEGAHRPRVCWLLGEDGPPSLLSRLMENPAAFQPRPKILPATLVTAVPLLPLLAWLPPVPREGGPLPRAAPAGTAAG